jgi:NAD+ synthase
LTRPELTTGTRENCVPGFFSFFGDLIDIAGTNEGRHMADSFRLTLAQLNPTVGALSDNAARAFAAWKEAQAAGADMIALPEMFLTGYQVQDLVWRGAFLRDVDRVLAKLAADCADGPAMGIGAPIRIDGALYNAFHILRDGKVAAHMLKHRLPNLEVFDEKRWFAEGPISGPYRIGTTRIGSPICEDAWHDDVAEAMVESGAEMLLVANGSPYERYKHERRINAMVARVIEGHLPLIYLNMVGGQDDQVFDGASFVLNPGGELAVQLPAFEEVVAHVDFEITDQGLKAETGLRATMPDEWEQDYRAMVEALRDYCGKSGFGKVLLGLSGGIDSALVATIAVDALGPENVRCVMLPSEFTSAHSLEDAAALAQALGTGIHEVPISAPVDAVGDTLSDLFAGTEPGLTEENIQARMRGLLLMAISNKFGEMLLTTGNKSELSVGYATIYGDMSGGYNPIKDLYKTRVFQTCRWRNENHRPWMKGPAGAVVQVRVIEKPPSAELRADQTDQDSLPEYDVLDQILDGLIDREVSVADLVAEGHDRKTVKRVEGLIFASEYKRFQSAPGARITNRALWLDRRYPLVNKWRDEG